MKSSAIQMLVLSTISSVWTLDNQGVYVNNNFYKNDALNRAPRQATNADQMVQNILQWLQGVYTQNSRKIRQGTLREYLPPSQTQKPRPFEASSSSYEGGGGGYPPAGSVTPQPPFPIYTNPTTGAVTGEGSYISTSTTQPEEATSTVAATSTTTLAEESSEKPGYSTQSQELTTSGYSTTQSVEDNEVVSSTTPQASLDTSDSSVSNSDTAEELRHPPHIHAMTVECGKEMMTINIEFNRKFDGIIYSKGFYSMPECRYVTENSGQTKYSFTVNLNKCGTEFINAFDSEGQSYLQNVLVLQNEPGIQEVWDSIRAVRCLWEGNLKESLSVALSVGMLSQEIVTFSGDTAMAKLDIQTGRGPFASPANGLVKIGETMTLVVSVSGDPGFDIHVKDCRATDSTGDNVVPLTDDNGCVLKPKLFGAFQKTRNTGDTGASIIAYAYFSAFKFPDVMDLMIECNIDLCKTDCEMCPNPGQNIEPGRRRRRRHLENNTLSEGFTMGKHLRVILPEDLSLAEATTTPKDVLCMSLQSFVWSAAILMSLLTTSSAFSAYFWLKNHRFAQKKY